MTASYTETIVYFATWSGTDTTSPLSTATIEYLLTGAPTTLTTTTTATHIEGPEPTGQILVQVIKIPVTVQSGGGAYTATDAESEPESTLASGSTLGPSTSTYTRTYTETTSDASGSLQTTTLTSTSTATFSPSTIITTYTTTETDASGKPKETSTITSTSTGLPTLGTFTSTYTTTTTDASGVSGTGTVTTTSYGFLPLAPSSTTATAATQNAQHMGGGTIAAIVVGTLAGIALVIFMTWWLIRHRAKNQVYEIQPSISSTQPPRSPGREAGFGLQPDSREKNIVLPLLPPRAATVASESDGIPIRHVHLMVPGEAPERGSVLNPTKPLPRQGPSTDNAEVQGDISMGVTMSSRSSKARRFFRKGDGPAVEQRMPSARSQKATNV